MFSLDILKLISFGFILTQVIAYIRLKDILTEKYYDPTTKIRLLALRTPILLHNQIFNYLSELLK